MNIKILQVLFFLLGTFILTPEMHAQCNGGNVVGPNGEGRVYTCPGDGQADIVGFQAIGETRGQGKKYQFVITDDNNVIIGFPQGNQQDFEGAGVGECRVWGFCYEGQITAQLGDHVFTTQFATEGWAISRNFLRVIRMVPDGGTVSLDNGATEKTICSQDGYDDPLVFTEETDAKARYRFLITNEDNVIVGIPPGYRTDLEGTPAGICRVWGISFTGDLTAEVGDDIETAMLASNCFDLSDNFITIIRTDVDGGMVSMPSGNTFITVFAGDGNPDIVNFQNTSSSSSNYIYVITDDNDVVLGSTMDPMADFENAGVGACRVYGVSYVGTLSIFPGDELFSKALSSVCFDISDNFITVNRIAPGTPFGGMVMTDDGDTETFTCPGDGNADIISFVSVGAAPDVNFTYVITDADGNILGIPPGDMADFEGAGVGACLVYGLSYTGNLTAEPGDNVNTDDLSDDEFSLSSNAITVNRELPEGGQVMMPSGATVRYTCPDDGEADVVSFVAEGASASKYAYIVTTPHLEIIGIILGDSNDFDGAGTGFCWVWGVAYTGEITAQLGDQLDEVMISDGCFDLSDNKITLIRDMPEAGVVRTSEGRNRVFFCAEDGNPDVLTFINRGASSSKYAYVITDNDQEILGINTGDTQDFEPAGSGICRVYGLAYTGNLTAEPGQNASIISFSDDCFDLSDNYITVTRDVPEAGMIMTRDGETEVSVMVNDGEDDIVRFKAQGIANLPYKLIVTDENNIILAIPPGKQVNFENSGVGNCKVWGVSYTGMIIAEPGDDITAVDLSNDCYDLSENFVTVTRTDATANRQIAVTTPDRMLEAPRAFPNPAFDLLQIRFHSEAVNGETVRLSVIDMYGRQVIDQSVPTTYGANTVELSVQHLLSGNYIVRLISEQGLNTLPFIKSGQ